MTQTERYVASVVVPAHDEARGIRRNLAALLTGVPTGALDVVVVANGCTDRTADEARAVPGVRVLEISEASKTRAVAVGNAATRVFPRIHLDADVTLAGPDALRLVAAVGAGLHAAAPQRQIPLEASHPLVRAYYRVWQQLPQVREGLFGRGAIALSQAGQARVSSRPALMSDDLVVSEAFAPHERGVVDDAVVVVRPPRTLADLLRRRTRVVTGTAQVDDHGLRHGSTSLTQLIRLGVRRPTIGARLPVFLVITLAARLRARRAIRGGDHTTWLRDESSRA